MSAKSHSAPPLSLKEFVEKLTVFLKDEDENSWKKHIVAIPLAEPSLGSSAITYISSGFDWDSGTLFITHSEPLIRAVRIDRAKAKEYGQRMVDHKKEGTSDQFFHKKEDVWMDAFMKGVDYGSRKLLTENSKKVRKKTTNKKKKSIK
jgi:hypothetical protein